MYEQLTGKSLVHVNDSCIFKSNNPKIKQYYSRMSATMIEFVLYKQQKQQQQ